MIKVHEVKLTSRTFVAELDLPPLTEAERDRLARQLGEAIDRQLLAILGGFHSSLRSQPDVYLDADSRGADRLTRTIRITT